MSFESRLAEFEKMLTLPVEKKMVISTIFSSMNPDVVSRWLDKVIIRDGRVAGTYYKEMEHQLSEDEFVSLYQAIGYDFTKREFWQDWVCSSSGCIRQDNYSCDTGSCNQTSVALNDESVTTAIRLPAFVRQEVDHFDLIGYEGTFAVPVRPTGLRCGYNYEGYEYEAFLLENTVVPPEGLTALLQVDTTDGITLWTPIKFMHNRRTYALGCDRVPQIHSVWPYYEFRVSTFAKGDQPIWPQPTSNSPWNCVGVGTRRQADGRNTSWIVNRNLKRGMTVSFDQPHLPRQLIHIPPGSISGGVPTLEYLIQMVSYNS